MNNENDKQKDIRLSQLLSAADRNTAGPDREFLDRLQEQSTAEFLVSSANDTKDSQVKIPFPIWRIIMKSNITKLAAAAVVIIGVLIGIHYSGGSVDGSNVVLADTIQTMKRMPWMHWTVISTDSGENILESWIGFDSGIFASKQYKEGKLLYNNKKENTEYTYKEKEGVIYYSQIDNDVRESYHTPDSAFELIEIMIGYLNKDASEIDRQTVIQDGKKIEIITAKMKQNSNLERIEFTRDVEENLILSIKADYKKLPDYSLESFPEEIREIKINSRIDTIAKYDYPIDGPKSIYDIGSPHDAKILYSYLPEEIEDLIKKLNSLRETNLTRYVAISVPADIEQLPVSFDGLQSVRYFTVKDHLFSSIWRKGDERLHSRGYFEESDNIPTLDNLPDALQNWAEMIVPVASNIYKSSERRIDHFQILNGRSIRSVRKGEVEIYGREVFIEQICWPRIVVPRQEPVQWKLESVAGDNNEELIMIERNVGGFRGRWSLNPDRDYICQKYEHAYSDGRPIETIEILEYANTQSGQWYPRILQKTENEYLNGKEQQQTFSRIIFLEEDPDFPDGIFDPDNLPKADE